jgi:2OG-Fe(II) oxygenase superfamily
LPIAVVVITLGPSAIHSVASVFFLLKNKKIRKILFLASNRLFHCFFYKNTKKLLKKYHHHPVRSRCHAVLRCACCRILAVYLSMLVYLSVSPSAKTFCCTAAARGQDYLSAACPSVRLPSADVLRSSRAAASVRPRVSVRLAARASENHARDLLLQSVGRHEFSKCAQQGVATKPRAGDALLFFSQTPANELDTHSLHSGCPVIAGEKWSATKWMRVGK